MYHRRVSQTTARHGAFNFVCLFVSFRTAPKADGARGAPGAPVQSIVNEQSDTYFPPFGKTKQSKPIYLRNSTNRMLFNIVCRAGSDLSENLCQPPNAARRSGLSPNGF